MLGICLGMQLLEIIDRKRINHRIRTDTRKCGINWSCWHIGWNTVHLSESDPPLKLQTTGTSILIIHMLTSHQMTP